MKYTHMITVLISSLATAHVSSAATYDLSCSAVTNEQLSLSTTSMDLDPPMVRRVYRLSIAGFNPNALSSSQIRIFGTLSKTFPDGSSTEEPFYRMVVGEAGVTVKSRTSPSDHRVFTISNGSQWTVSLPDESVLAEQARTKSKISIFVNPSYSAWPGVQETSSLPSNMMCWVQ